ncbi:thermostable beta-glucosidase B [Fusarium flagelliforme]|uniref:beta-glucosidase n=1 Tax=Fusarium flagelliforme TaxID=2675880 RepID=A0A395M8K5_9HYPO|nr:thermostable beta-glucosidase B [Fusarium flagelliforme]KAH7175090.1 thermostable beta-glucosidase B [Fusarium flagelliforme]RFN44214.1 thermostable beta-glucosidase b [Fusarium flagelliforme]
MGSLPSTDDDFCSLLSKLTLREKITLLSGQDFSTIAGVSRLNIPPIRVADSTSGIRPSGIEANLTTASFPNTTCYGSTWDSELLFRVGTHLAKQARMKGAQVVLGPTINIHRDPRAGRNFECFSEDPLLSGELAAALVNGVQSLGVGSCPKHFVCNDSETLRRYYNVQESVDSRALREVYLAAWQHLLRSSDPEGIMTAYNKVDGQFCSQNSSLTQRVLRDEWKFKGLTMSDWFGTHATAEPVKAGLDIEMPFPVFRGDKLLAAVKSGSATEAEIDTLALRALELRNRTRAALEYTDERSEVDEETNKLAREVATSGMVLLKNENNALPIKAEQSSRIAVVGQYASDPVITGGGSASSIPQYRHSPLDILTKRLPGMVQYSPGVRTRRIIPIAPLEKLTSPGERPGVLVRYYNAGDPEPVFEEFQEEANVWMLGDFDKKGLRPVGSHLEMLTRLEPETSGSHTLAVRCTGAFSLCLNGRQVLSGQEANVTTEQFIFNHVLLETRVEVSLDAGVTYDIHLHMAGPTKMQIGEPTPYAATLCFEEYSSEDDAIAEAVEMARSADATIIYAGRNDQYESEGFDLEDIRMPENQTKLINAVAAVAKKTILVMHCGNPIDVSAFVDSVDAVLLAHFPGQEGAAATVELLLGDVCPSGRLATTWFKTLQDCPSYGNFPAQESGDGDPCLRYAEGVAVGYRAPDCKDRVRWRFGYGLSYTTFSHSNLKAFVDETSEPRKLKCVLDVQNTGTVCGKEVIHVFVKPCETTKVWRPEQELKGFTKVFLEPGESRQVEVHMDLDMACSYWDDQERTWRLEAGVYGVVVADQVATFTISKSSTWNTL